MFRLSTPATVAWLLAFVSAFGCGETQPHAATTDLQRGRGEDVAPPIDVISLEDVMSADVGADTDGISDTLGQQGADAPIRKRGGPTQVWLAGASTEGTDWLDWPEPNQQVPEIFGPQGGYHVWVSFCVPEGFGDSAQVELTLVDEQTGLSTPPGKVVLNTLLESTDTADGRRCRIAIPAFVTCACLTDKRLTRIRLSVRPLGSDGPWSWSERVIRPIHVQGPCVNQKTLICQAWGSKL